MFLLLLAVVPLPLGSNRPWAWAPLALSVGAILGLRMLAAFGRREALSMPWPAGLAIATTLAVMAWAWLQGTSGLLPEAWTHPIWKEVAAAGLDVEPIVSLAAERSRDNLMRLMTYGAVFFLALTFARDRKRARTLFRLLLLVIGLEALYGLLRDFAGLQLFPWEETGQAGTAVTGTFVNRNNFATYLNLGILIGAALLFEGVMRAAAAHDLRRLVVAFLDEVMGKRSLLLATLLLLISASLLTGSRGGFLSLAAALVLFVFLVMLLARPRLSRALGSLAALVFLAWVLLGLSGSLTLERLTRDDESGSNRLLAYTVAIELIGERPWLGHGYGTFAEAFLPHRDERFEGQHFVYRKAHNTYLEHAVELGLPATAFLYLGPIVLSGFMLRGVFRRRRDRIFPLVGVTATLLVGVHALVDFSLQIPAVAVTYAAILGTAVVQSVSRHRTAHREADPRTTAKEEFLRQDARRRVSDRSGSGARIRSAA